MIIPILCFCCVVLLAGKKDERTRRDNRIVPRRGETPIDTALSYAIGRGYDAEQTLAYVTGRVYPGREHDIDTVRRVRDQVQRRLASPGFAKRCKGGCRGG